MVDKQSAISKIEQAWADEARWSGVVRRYKAEDVYRLRGSFEIEYSLARHTSERLWELMHSEPYVHVLSAITRQPGHPGGSGRTQGHLRERLAGGRRCQQRPPDVSRSESLPQRQRSPGGAPNQQRAACAPTRSIIWLATTANTGWLPLWPTPRLALADRCTLSRS